MSVSVLSPLSVAIGEAEPDSRYAEDKGSVVSTSKRGTLPKGKRRIPFSTEILIRLAWAWPGQTDIRYGF